MSRPVWLAVFLLMAAAAAACAPRVQAPGPLDPPGRAHLDGPVFVTPDGVRLPLRVWRACDPKAVIVALHGMNDYGRAFDAAAQWWATQADLTTYALDQRGFGEAPQRGIWPGGARLVADAGALVEAVRMRHPGRPVVLLGHSMGGAVALAALGEGAAHPDGTVLIAPAVWGWSSLPFTHRAALWIAARLFPGRSFTGGGLDITPSDNIEMLRALSRDPLVIKETRADAIYGLVDLMDRAYTQADRARGPVLLLYGDRDEIIPAAPIETVATRLDASDAALTFHRYQEGYHMLLRDLRAQAVWADVAAWSKARPEGPLSARHAVQDAVCLGTP